MHSRVREECVWIVVSKKTGEKLMRKDKASFVRRKCRPLLKKFDFTTQMLRQLLKTDVEFATVAIL